MCHSSLAPEGYLVVFPLTAAALKCDFEICRTRSLALFKADIICHLTAVLFVRQINKNSA